MDNNSGTSWHSLAFLLCLLLTRSGLALAPTESEIAFDSVLVEQRQGEWQVSLPNGTKTRFGLRDGDVLLTVDGEPASQLGPLALSAFMNNAAARTFPLEVQRHGKPHTILFSQADKDPPKSAKLLKASAVSRSVVAPDFKLPSLAGKEMELAALRGHWVLLSFWATWCLPCQAEAPILTRLSNTYSPALRVVAVAVQDKHEAIETFAKRTRPAYDILESGDLKSTVAINYGVNTGMGSATIPLSVLIRPDGTVAYVQGGFDDESALERVVAGFLN